MLILYLMAKAAVVDGLENHMMKMVISEVLVKVYMESNKPLETYF